MQHRILIILTILRLNSVSKVIKRSVHLIASKIDSLFKHAQNVSHSLYSGNTVFKISSGDNFKVDLVDWVQKVNSTNPHRRGRNEGTERKRMNKKREQESRIEEKRFSAEYRDNTR